MAEQVISLILNANSTITAIVGNSIAPAYTKEFESFPFITYAVTAYDPTVTQTGSIAAAKLTVQIDAWAVTYKSAALLQLAIRRALQGYKGIIGGINVRNITTDGRTSLANQVPEGASAPVYSCSSDYDILHLE